MLRPRRDMMNHFQARCQPRSTSDGTSGKDMFVGARYNKPLSALETPQVESQVLQTNFNDASTFPRIRVETSGEFSRSSQGHRTSVWSDCWRLP